MPVRVRSVTAATEPFSASARNARPSLSPGEEAVSRGAESVGARPTDRSDVAASKTGRGRGFFCALALDEDHAFEPTESRLETRVAQIEPALRWALGPAAIPISRNARLSTVAVP
jgi:hypothetical protein